jgi:hypothetical protein
LKIFFSNEWQARQKKQKEFRMVEGLKNVQQIGKAVMEVSILVAEIASEKISNVPQTKPIVLNTAVAIGKKFEIEPQHQRADQNSNTTQNPNAPGFFAVQFH